MPEEKNQKGKRPVESAAAEEIGTRWPFGSIFLMISTSGLESTKRFPHLPQGPAAASLNGEL